MVTVIKILVGRDEEEEDVVSGKMGITKYTKTRIEKTAFSHDILLPSARISRLSG